MYTNSSRSYLKMASGTPRRTNGTPWRTGGTPTAEYSVFVIQGAQLDVEGSGGHGKELDFRIINFLLP